jgi:GTPase SAR1 family protein
MKFKKFTALFCASAFMSLNLINVSAEDYKTVLLGGESAGKTQISNKIVDGSFSGRFNVTTGAAYTAFVVAADHFDIWDTSGQKNSSL